MVPPVRTSVFSVAVLLLMSNVPAEFVNEPFVVKLLVTTFNVPDPLWLTLLNVVPPLLSVWIAAPAAVKATVPPLGVNVPLPVLDQVPDQLNAPLLLGAVSVLQAGVIS